MLRKLTIQNYALIEHLDISFPEGLVIITGETGAGKSILLGAISLLLGTKSDTSVFMDSTKNCVVEAEFDDNSLLRRVISPNGRSRSFMNDEPLSLTELSAISKKIIDIHAQNEHLLLSDPDYQLSILDYYAGTGNLLAEYKKIFEKYKEISDNIKRLESEIAAETSEAEYNEFQFKQLQDAKLVVGELEELEEEQKRLANAEEIKTMLNSTSALLNPYDTSLVQSLKEASALLSKGGRYLKALEDLSERVLASKIELGDIELEINKISEEISISPDKLQLVEERLSLLYSLFKKHNSSSVEELIEVRESLDSSLLNRGSKEERLNLLRREAKELDQRRISLAEELSALRGAAAPTLSNSLQSSIRELEMPYSEFRIELNKSERLTSSGCDTLKFLFSANGAGKLGEVSKVASGGELSRVMLSLKALMAKYTELPTMIFDEIDTGVSGRIADKMGSLIWEMSQNMQIFAITHLPQIASKPGAHYLVYKEMDGLLNAKTKIKQLSEEERVVELARMLSGSSLSDAAIENAKVLLKENSKK